MSNERKPGQGHDQKIPGHNQGGQNRNDQPGQRKGGQEKGMGGDRNDRNQEQGQTPHKKW